MVELLEKFARCNAPVLIEGETGTGKEVAARYVHYHSSRTSGPFVPVNCGAIPDNLFENEFFGHEKGAFTDARTSGAGYVTLADGGTLFLDEIDSLSGKGQVALLRFLQDRTYRRLGGSCECRADVRVIAAANTDLESLADRNAFRRDLLFRIKLLFIKLTPLRRRIEDIPILAEHFVDECSREYGIAQKRLAPEAIAWLELQPWPGNVRELENLMHRAFLLTEAHQISVAALGGSAAIDLTINDQGSSYRAAKAHAVEQFHRRYLTELLRAVHGNVSRAARRCGTDRRAFGRLLKRYNVPPAQFRA